MLLTSDLPAFALLRALTASLPGQRPRRVSSALLTRAELHRADCEHLLTAVLNFDDSTKQLDDWVDAVDGVVGDNQMFLDGHAVYVCEHCERKVTVDQPLPGGGPVRVRCNFH